MGFVIGCICGAIGFRLWQKYRDHAEWKRLVAEMEFRAGGTSSDD